MHGMFCFFVAFVALFGVGFFCVLWGFCLILVLFYCFWGFFNCRQQVDNGLVSFTAFHLRHCELDSFRQKYRSMSVHIMNLIIIYRMFTKVS